MAARPPPPPEPETASPCCAAWKRKYMKSEKFRIQFREACTMLETKIDQVQAQHSALLNEYEGLRVLAENEKEEKMKESAARVSLENEVSELKSEVLSLKQQEGMNSQDTNEVESRKGQVSEQEQEISRLKELVEREKKRAESESKKLQVEKKKAAEAQKSLKIEKKKSDDERKRATVEEEKAEQYKLQLEVLEKEVAGSKSNSEAEKEINSLKELIEREQKRAEAESKKVEVEKKKAAEAQRSLKIEKKKTEDERKRAAVEEEKVKQYKLQLEVLENEVAKAKSNSEAEKETSSLKVLIEREKKRAETESKNAEVEKKKAAESLKSMKAEKCKADKERKRANVEAEKAENYRLRLEVLEKELDKLKSNLASETLKLEIANKNLESEKQKVSKERECTISEKTKYEELRKLEEANRRKTTEEISHAESLSLQLAESRKRIDELQKELNRVRCSTKLQAEFRCQSDSNRIDTSREVSGLEEANKRYEVEKLKAMNEKKRADSEAMKTQKQKQLADLNLKKATEEKSRADHLSRQLDEAKKEIEELSTRKLIDVAAVQRLAKGMDYESEKVKLLKKRLKLEKMQRKHSKEVVDLESNRNSILHQELGRLKLDCDHISRRLYMLNNSGFYSAGGIEDHEKAWNIIKKQRLSNTNYQESDSLQLNPGSGTDVLKTGFPVLNASDPFREAMQHTAPYPPLSGGNYTGSVSGIDSRLESPRGSERNMFKSSAINSSTASFSDGQLMGSQEKGVTVPTKLVEENVLPAISILSTEKTEAIRMKCNETIAVVAENTVRSPVRSDGIGKVNGHSRKRKRIIDAIESIKNLFCEGNKFNQKVETKLSDLHCLLSKKCKKPVEERLHEKREAVCGDNLVLTSGLIRNEQKADRYENECMNVCRQVPKFGDEHIKTPLAIKDGINDSVFSDMARFDEVTDGNYLKLLELDDAADEECYRMAMEVPLSPTLPEFEVQDFEASQANKINPLIQEAICNGYSNKNAGNCWDTRGLNGDCSGNSVAMGKSCDIQVHDFGAEVVSNSPIIRNDGDPGDNIFQHVVFSNTDESGSLSRICDAFRSCIAQCPWVNHTEWMMQDILVAVKSEKELLPKEKVSVLYSLLLLNFSTAASSKFGDMYWKSNPCLNSFAQHMHSVMSDGNGRAIFSEFGSLDESLGLVEDFIIQRRVFICKDTPARMMAEFHSGHSVTGNVDISSRPASTDELVAGSIVLASLCATFDHIGFLCGTSYNILLNRGLDRSLALKMLHVFAYMGGGKFLTSSDYSLVNVLKSIVRFLEEVGNLGNEFCPCVECPFSEDAVSVDAAVSCLLERVMQSDNTNSDIILCDLSDLLSLVELVSSNMSWRWTSAEVIPQLMKILESCNSENVIAGVIVLLGQLGRLGVESVGYEDTGVEFLRHELSAFLCRDSATGASLPTQIAIVTSMLSLMSFDFKSLVQGGANPSAIASQSDDLAAQSIRRWFSLLPKKQQDLSFSLLQTANVDKSRGTVETARIL